MKKALVGVLALSILTLAIIAPAAAGAEANNLVSGQSYSLSVSPSPFYADSDNELTDGQLARPVPWDSRWVGFGVGQPEIKFTLNNISNITRVEADFLSFPIWGIFFPNQVELFTSSDNVNWVKAGNLLNSNGLFSLDLPDQRARFVKFKINRKFWSFIDEIRIFGQPIVNDPGNNLVAGCQLQSGLSVFQPSPFYPDSSSELTDQNFASLNPLDAGWIGFDKSKPSVIFDLGTLASLNRIKAYFLDYPAWGIRLPQSVAVELSSNGVSWSKQGSLTRIGSTFQADLNQPNARFIRLNIERDFWAFISEVEVLGEGPVSSCQYYYNQWQTNPKTQMVVDSVNVPEIGKGENAVQFRVWVNSIPTPGAGKIDFALQFDPSIIQIDRILGVNPKCSSGFYSFDNSAGVIRAQSQCSLFTDGAVIRVDAFKKAGVLAGQTSIVSWLPFDPLLGVVPRIFMMDGTPLPLENMEFVNGIITFTQ